MTTLAAASRRPRSAAYAAGWRDFLSFCERRGANPLPATDETVAGYLAELADAGLKAATIARRLVVISQAHQAADLPSPTTSSLVRRTHAGIRRAIGTAQTAKAPAVATTSSACWSKLPNTRVGLRDRALLLLGFAGAFRRSELVALDVADLDFSSAGLVVTLQKIARRTRRGARGASASRMAPRAGPARCARCRPGSRRRASPRARSSARSTSSSGCSRGGSRTRPSRVIVKRRAAAVGLDPARYARPLAAGWPGDQRRGRRRLRAGDHGPDRPPLGGDGPALHPRGEPLHRGQRGQSRGPVSASASPNDTLSPHGAFFLGNVQF